MIIGDIMIDTNLWKTRIGGWLTKSWGESVRFFTTIFSALRPEDYVIFGLILILIWSHF